MGAKPTLRIFRDLDAMSRAAAGSIAESIHRSTSKNHSFSIALSGGNTPRALYEILSAEFRDRIEWRKVHLFWGDERFVPQDDPHSNYRMVEETLLRRVPVPRENVFPLPTDRATPDDAAHGYDGILRACFPSPWPRFDLVLLGLGEEGHTASLFPGAKSLRETHRWVVAVEVPATPPIRLTLTLPALNHAALIYFLATGANKARAVQQAIEGNRDNEACPAAMVRPEDGELVWWLDDAAAALLRDSPRAG